MPVKPTPAFQKWFGDSKAVDEAGQPLVLYHGTTYNFTSFSLTNAYYQGAFFTPDRDVAKMFGPGKNGAIHAVYLAICNPKTIDAEVVGRWTDPDEEEDGVMRFMHDTFEKKKQIDLAIQEGFDGLLIRDLPEDNLVSDQWIAFRPEQIKSARANSGDFDGTNPDIRFSLVDQDEENEAENEAITTETPCP
jgi:hypothetical protein